MASLTMASVSRPFIQAITKEPTDWQLWFRLAEASTGPEQRRALAEARRLNPRSPELSAFEAE